MTTHRTILGAGVLCVSASIALPAAAASKDPAVAASGLYTQPVFIETLDFANHHTEAAAEQKGLVVDMRGSREVTDFDGEEMKARALARKWGVDFTPPLLVFAAGADVDGKPGNPVEPARLPGHFKPFHFLSTVAFVESGACQGQPFQRFLQQKGERLREQAIAVDL